MPDGDDRFEIIFGRTAVEKKFVTTDELDSVRADPTLKDQTLSDALVSRGYLTVDEKDTLLGLVDENLPPDSIPGYRLESVLGRGGAGVVYRAVTKDGGQVAVKILDPALARNPKATKRFLREAEAMEKLDHPNIVRALDAGRASGRLYMVMEYVEGQTLQERIPLDEKTALKVLRDVANALDHSRDIVHRDIKPANIIIDKDGVTKLTDFGLVRDELEPSLTASGSFLGTPYYCSPEQAQGLRTLDSRSDIYSLGATMYHALTGRVPFDGDSAFTILNKHVNVATPSARKANPKLSHQAEALLARMMAKQPEKRPATAKELLALLDDFKNLKLPRAPRRLPVLPIVLLCVAAGAATWALWPRKKEPPPVVKKKEPIQGRLDRMADGKSRLYYDFSEADQAKDFYPHRPETQQPLPVIRENEFHADATEVWWNKVVLTGELTIETSVTTSTDAGFILAFGREGNLQTMKVSFGREGKFIMWEGGRRLKEIELGPTWNGRKANQLRVQRTTRGFMFFANNRRVHVERIGLKVVNAPDYFTFALIGPVRKTEENPRNQARFLELKVVGLIPEDKN